MRDTHQERRRTIVIDRAVQRRIVASVVLVPTAALAVAALVVAVFCRRLVHEARAAEADLPSLLPLFLTILGFCVVCSVVIAVRGLRFSHRIAGPTYRICRDLATIRTTGDAALRIRVRKADFLHELAAEINEFLDWVETRRRAPPPCDAEAPLASSVSDSGA